MDQLAPCALRLYTSLMPVLYRTYRPATWSEVIGQDAVVSTLRESIAQGRPAHAYLFSGSRGTGKTSVARILAKELKTADEATIVFERNGLKVIAFKVEHDPVKPAYGYRLDYHGRSVVISGDTTKSANLARHAAGADLLIHEVLAKDVMTCASTNLERAGDKRRAKLMRDILSYHTSPAEAAEVAATAKVETLVFTHMVPPINPPVTEQMFLRGVAEIFKGKVVIAKDGLRFDLPARN